jgi:hypothetical protein
MRRLNCFALSVDMYEINFTTKADILARKLEASFATGFVDIEESCRIVDVATTQELHEPTDTGTGTTAAHFQFNEKELIPNDERNTKQEVTKVKKSVN